MTIKLSNATLGQLPASVIKPTYNRSALRPGIVHIGLGNFHRAHQAWYLHRLFQQGLNMDWAIVGAGVRPYDEQMRLKMKAQDYLTTLIELDPEGTSAEVCGSMIDYVPVTEGNGPLIERLADPAIRIVALTVTEGGYYINQATSGFDATHPDIEHDAENPGNPKTAFGAIVAALRLRRDRGIGPFTGLCCDNLRGNGDILRQTVVSLARLSDPELADWINTTCSFPNSMVDSIVPATGPKELLLAQDFGIDDAVPVTHERFRQWVMEDDFCAGRPDWDKAGATFSNNVHDYEVQKIRILNAGHQVLANVAELLHIETIAESMANEKLHALFHKVEIEEIVPHVVLAPGMTPEQYVELVGHRFANHKIIDTTRRVAFDGSSRHPSFIIPTIRDGLNAGTPIEGLALVEAAWARMCSGTGEDGSEIESNDPFWDQLTEKANAAKSDPRVWIEMRNIYGDLAEQPRFASAFANWLNLIYARGIEAALDVYLNTGASTGSISNAPTNVLKPGYSS